MATLTGKTIASTYTSLLKLEGDSGSTVAGGSAAVQVKTGDDDDTPIYLNTDRVGINNAAPGSQLEISKVSGAATLELSSWSATATAAHAGKIIFQKSGTATVNTFTGGDHTTAGEVLGRIEAWGVDDDDGATLSSYIEFANDAVSDADSSPGKITFATSDADDAGTPTARMTIDDGGNVGIGLADPSYPLEIMGSSGKAVLSLVSDDTDVANGDDLGAIYFMGNDDLQATRALGAYIMAEAAGDWGAGASTNDSPTELQFFTQSDTSSNGLADPRMTIASDGNVGIGIATPGAKLTIDSGDILLDNTQSLIWTQVGGNPYTYIKGDGEDLDFYTSNAVKMSLTAAGKVGIGTAAVGDSARFQVKAAAAGEWAGWFEHTEAGGSADPRGIYVEFASDLDAADDYFMICTAGGVSKMTIRGDGDVWTVDAGAPLTSDRDLKEDIVDASPKLDDLLKLKVRNFKFKAPLKKDDKKRLGFIAQEFEEVFPSLVKEHISPIDAEADAGIMRKELRQGILIPILVKAVQELSAKVTALENA
jgi:hypothetical protein